MIRKQETTALRIISRTNDFLNIKGHTRGSHYSLKQALKICTLVVLNNSVSCYLICPFTQSAREPPMLIIYLSSSDLIRY